jgi:hypothetical protein
VHLHPTATRSAPIGKWTKPGVLGKHFGPAKPNHFYIAGVPDGQLQLHVNLRGIRLRCIDEQWRNLGSAYEPGMTQLTDDETVDKIRENAFLRNEIEVLLDMNAN